MSRTRIVATIGPATNNRDTLLALAEAGMNVARLNGAHGDLEWHSTTIDLLHSILPEMPILFDIPGRKVRVGQLRREPSFKVGETIILTTEPGYEGSEKIPVNYLGFHETLSPGALILIDDGTLRFTVVQIRGRDIACRAEVAGQLRSGKGINAPSARLSSELVTEQDKRLVAFARDKGVDFVGISYVESAGHLQAFRRLIDGSWPRIVSKIENQASLNNLSEIIQASDALMIDRGDLSGETSLEGIVLVQKRILEEARSAGCPVIVATEMLQSMISATSPTKAEVSDITNGVLDGCAATMLSSETAIGAHPVEALSVMQRISDAAEDYLQNALDNRSARPGSVPQVMEDAVALVCRSLPITKIVAVTISGYAARMISARRPRQPILAVSNDFMAARSFHLLPGTEGVYVDMPFSRTSTDHIVKCLEELWRRNRLVDDDLVLVTAVGYPRSGNRMNLIQTHQVSDLVEALRWSR